MGTNSPPNAPFAATREWVASQITEEQVVMNMINSFLGRMHLQVEIPLDGEWKAARCVYPQSNALAYRLDSGKLCVEFTKETQARFFELKRGNDAK